MTDPIKPDPISTTEPDFSGPPSRSIQDWTDLGKEMWSYLTGKSAVIDYSFIDMTVEVPRDIGPDAPRATWKLNGTVRVTTSEAPAGAGSELSSSTD
ncbi:hypothetical protein BJQ94_13065 [Cryobacterium sp. SO2]|uniref:hypothetical protein n=1 Tax=Cryobacterium sp. SO2 TaxID=1897060 RepID=UPI00223D3726|nr:hypothetical protein [Cryobacterium sp. SO2]WEO76288.1 hypothetical protein BJQ94_13065 [Cryobacterium sp. SO2]